MQSDTVRPARPKKSTRPKSSEKARRLIRATLRRCKNNQSAAARALRLPNQGQLRKMLLGTLKDTPEMKAAIVRANVRAKRAWSFEKLDPAQCVDPAHLKHVINDLSRLVETLRALTPKEGNHTNGNNLQNEV